MSYDLVGGMLDLGGPTYTQDESEIELCNS